MSRFQYFKITFLIVSAGLVTGLIVYNLLTLENYTTDSIMRALFKSVFVGVFTALILGLLNMFFKLTVFKKQQ